MNRTYTSIAVLTMVLVAVGMCLAYTIEFRDVISTSTIVFLFTAEGVIAGAAIASGVSVLRKRFARQKKPITRRPVASAVRA